MISAARSLCPGGQEFLELSVRGVPRYFVPANNWRVRGSGSGIYLAFRRSARAYRAALRAWITVGGARLTHRTRWCRGDEWPLGETLLPDLPTLSTAAILVGIPGPAQKITVQLMDGRGKVLGFAKYAASPYTRELIANEARMLQKLPESLAPRLVRFAPFLEGDLLVQTALPGKPRVPHMRLDTAQARFFGDLTDPERVYEAPEHPFVRRLYSRAGDRRRMLEAVVEDLKDSEWRLAWLHGDMAPWNMHWWHGDCLAFDWEHGKEEGFAYLDAAATLIQVASKIRRLGPQQAKRAVSERLEPHLPVRYGGYAPAIAALSALNMLVSWYPPRKPDAYEGWLETFVKTTV